MASSTHLPPRRSREPTPSDPENRAEPFTADPELDEPPRPSAKVRNLTECRIPDMPGAEVYYLPSFVSQRDAAGWYEELQNIAWTQPRLTVSCGREVRLARKVAAYSNNADLSLKYHAQGVDVKYGYPPLLLHIQNLVERRLGVRFNQLMLNYYENGNDYTGKHRDGEGSNVIASLSLGAERTFVMTRDPKRILPEQAIYTHTKLYAQERRWTLQSGSLVVMQGDTQAYWKHEILKEPSINTGRISLIFRQRSG